jgi:sugar transferase EpsL
MRSVKRIIDIFGAIVGLVLFGPLMLVVAALVATKLGRPVLFTQNRAGVKGRAFKLVKFRSMTTEVDAEGKPLPDEVRLTKFGKLLRATSMDELPQFWNVLKGDISLVGPRPLHLVYVERYNSEQIRRLDVPPGITGWAQVNGRNSLSWDEKFALDCWYVDNWSLILDLKILVMTVQKVFKREGTSSADHVTMEEFMGSTKLS